MRNRSHRVLLACAAWPCALLAQAHAGATHAGATHGGVGLARDSLAVMATVLGTRVSPARNARPRTEGLLTQPMLMLRGARFAGALRYAAMLNGEHWTMPDGEPVAGIWGEGFIDRRHPHTVLHEVMLSGLHARGRLGASISAGKGVVPFGTDDPMSRPFTKYPANHHLAQVLERVQLVAALRLLPMIAIEGATFNGDDPASPTAAPEWRRFGDSRAARLTIWPVSALELQASSAFVQSPEFASGEGLDQQKLSSSARWSSQRTPERYALLEWGRTAEVYRGREIVRYGTVLAEALVTHGRLTVAARFERTSRPEEERLLDPFRTPRPHADFTIKGMTQWHLATLHLATPLPGIRGLHGRLFGEATWARSRPLLVPVLLDPANISGSDVAWHVSAGVRLGIGSMAARVGRYGVATGPGSGGRSLTMPAQH